MGRAAKFEPTRLKEDAQRLNAVTVVAVPKFAAGPNGSYYVLMESEIVGKFVLQRFHENELQASTEIEPPPAPGKEEEQEPSEGVNVALTVDPNPNGDPSRERAYVLFVYERRGPNKSEEGNGEYPLDSEMQAAGSLYAFEYDSASKQLISAKTEKKKEGKTEVEVPAPALDRQEIHSESEEKHPTAKERTEGKRPPPLESDERPLLDPRGMAVDPATGDLAISGNEDEALMENIEGEPEEVAGEAKEEKQCRAAVQFVSVKTTGSGPMGLLARRALC